MALSTIPISGADQSMGDHPNVAWYLGFTLRETTGTDGAVVEIYDGSSTSGELIEVITLSPNESDRVWMPSGIKVESGLYIEIVSGSVRGCVRVG